MSASLCLGRDTSGDLQALNINPSGELIVTTGAGGTQDVNIVNDSVGLATESTLSALNTKITTGEDDTLTSAQQVLIYGRKDATPTGLRAIKVQDNGGVHTFDTTLNPKISKGEDTTITGGTGGLQQVLLYGRDNTGDLHPIKTTPQGDIDVEIADFVKGQAVSASSFPVVIASDQSDLKVIKPDASVTTDSLAPTAGSTAVTTGVDLDGTNGCVSFIGVSTNTQDQIEVQFSADNVTWYTSQDYFVNQDVITGEYGFTIENLAVRYIRLRQIDNVTSAWTWTSIASKK